MSKVKKIIIRIIIILFSIFINNGAVLAEEVEAFDYYYQGNYYDVPYCGNGKTVSRSGCGATSLAVIASSLSSSKFTPRVVAPLICKEGHVGKGTKWSAFTDKDILNKLELKVDVLFKENGKIRGNAGKTYEKEKGNKILNAVKQGKGVVLHIPGHYVAVGPHPKCDDNEVYYYQVADSRDNGCYTPKELFNKSFNYKKRCCKDKNCNETKNCGWKAAFAFESIPRIKVYYNANGAKLGNNKYKLNSTNDNILKASDGRKYYKTYKETDKAIDLLNYNGTTFKMSYKGMRNASPVWNTKANGKGTSFYQKAGKHNASALFKASGCTENKNCSITLYAQWKPIKYNIHYVGNGATGQVYDKGHCDSNGKCGLDVYTTGTKYDKKTQTFKHATNHFYNSNVTLRKNRFYKKGYSFKGWAESASGVVKYQDKDTVRNLTTTNEDIIYLYAKWTKDETSDDSNPDDTKSDDTKPDDTKPDDTNPDDTNPDDTNPDDSIPEEINKDILEPEESEPVIEEVEEDIIDNNSNNEIEEDNDEVINEEGSIDEDFGDDISDTEENITNNPKTGSNNFIILSLLIFIISILSLIYYRKVYYQ